MIEDEYFRKAIELKTAVDFIGFYQANGVENLIKILKYSGKLVNSYDGEWRFQKEFNKIKDYIEKNDENDYIVLNKTEEEAKCLNLLYENLYKIEDYIKAKSIPDEFSTASFIIILESYLEFLLNVIDGNDEKNQELGLDFEVDSAFGGDKSKMDKFIDIYEHCIFIVDEVIKYLLFYKNRDITHEYEVDCDYLQASLGHIIIADQKSIIKEIENKWRYMGGRIYKKNEEIYSECKTREMIDFFIIKTRLEDRKNIINNDLFIEQDINNILCCEDGISDDEKRAILYLKNIFVVNNLNYTCTVIKKGNKLITIPLNVLVRAYAILKIENTRFIQEKQIFSNNLQEVCLVLDIGEVQDLFVSNGISDEYIEKIIFILTLESYKDIIDTPLIPFNNKYIMIPSIVKQTDITQVILSCVNQFNFRGKAFESSIRNSLSEVGIKAISESQEVENDEYQCDVLFGLGKTLFICECKAWGEPESIYDYYEYIENCNKAKKQLDRISEYYLSKKEELQVELEMQDNITQVQKIILISNAVGNDNKIDNTIITDSSMLYRFIKRQKPAIVFYHDKKQYIYDMPKFTEFEGKITANKLINFLNCTSSVQLSLKNMQFETRKIVINNIPINYDTILQKVNLSCPAGQSYDSFLQNLNTVYSLTK